MGISGEEHSDGGNSWCRGPEARAYLGCSRIDLAKCIFVDSDKRLGKDSTHVYHYRCLTNLGETAWRFQHSGMLWGDGHVLRLSFRAALRSTAPRPGPARVARQRVNSKAPSRLRSREAGTAARVLPQRPRGNRNGPRVRAGAGRTSAAEQESGE